MSREPSAYLPPSIVARRRGSDNDDPTIVRHVHDLAALKTGAATSGDFAGLVRKAMSDDAGRGGAGRGGEPIASSDPAPTFTDMLDRLGTDPLWAVEYRDYVRQVSFAEPDELPDFEQALNALRDLVTRLTGAWR